MGFRDESCAKKSPFGKRAKGRIRFGLSLDEKKKPRYKGSCQVFLNQNIKKY